MISENSQLHARSLGRLGRSNTTKCRRKVKSRRPGFEKLHFGFFEQYKSDDFRKLWGPVFGTSTKCL